MKPTMIRFARILIAGVLATLATTTARASVWLSSYSFAPNNLPYIYSNDGVTPMYKLRMKINGVQYANTWNNNGLKVDSAPAPGTYTVQTYFLQYDSTGSTLLTIGPMASNTLTVLSPVNGVNWNGIYMPGTATPGSTISFQASVTNTGNTLWDSNYFLELKDSGGNHLYYPSLATTSPGGSISPTFYLTLPSAAGVYTYYFTALQNGVQYFGPTVGASITVNTNPTTTLSLSSTSITVGQSVTATSTTTDPDGNLINQAIDYLPPGGSWVSGTGANGFRWDGAATSSNTVSNSIALTTVGTWQFRARGADNLGGISNFQTVNVTVNNGSPPSAPTASGATNITQSSFQANWSSNGANGYQLDVSTSSGFGTFVAGYQNLDVGNTTSRPVTGLSANTTYYYRVRAYNGFGTSGNSATITVLPVPVINSSTSVSTPTGSAFNYQITATNGPTSYSATGLPAWLSINTTSGVLSGTPSTSGTYTCSLTAYNASGASNSVTLTITVAASGPQNDTSNLNQLNIHLPY